MKKLLMTAMILAFAASAYAGTGVKNSKHDIPFNFSTAAGVDAENTALASFGGGNRICGYCHTPHHATEESTNGLQPLWARSQSTEFGTYSNYTSFTIDGGTDNGDGTQSGNEMLGSSWLCLSCHDGGLAVDQHYNFSGDATLVSKGDGFGGGTAVGLGGDLANDHPIGVNMVAAMAAEAAGGSQTGLKDPTAQVFIGNTLIAGFTVSDYLFAGEVVTCSSCHDVHNKDTVDGAYMLYSSVVESAICFSCHDK